MKPNLSTMQWLAIAGAIVLFLVLMIAIPVALGVILSLPLLLFLPGFVMTWLLFPRESLGIVERLLLSIGLSVAVTAVSGLILNLTPWGLQAKTIWIALLLGLALEFAILFLTRRTWWRDETFSLSHRINFSTRQWVLMALAAFMTLMALRLTRMPTPQQGFEGYTLLSSQPADTADAIRLDVRSEEFAKTGYQIKYQYNGTLHDGPKLELNPGETWEQVVPIPVKELAGKPFTILLYRLDNPTEVYRHVEWWPEAR